MHEEYLEGRDYYVNRKEMCSDINESWDDNEIALLKVILIMVQFFIPYCPESCACIMTHQAQGITAAK